MTHLIHHGEEYGDKEAILQELFRILNKRSITDADHPIQIVSERYPEDGRKKVKESYRKDKATCKILEQEEERLIPKNEEDAEDGCDIINYTMLLPLWYIVYMFFDNYGRNDKRTSAEFQKMTKNELRQTLQTYDKTRPETYINHDIIMLDLAS